MDRQFSGYKQEAKLEMIITLDSNSADGDLKLACNYLPMDEKYV